MNCTMCGAENRGDSHYCRNCGTALVPSSTEAPTQRLPAEPRTQEQGYHSQFASQQENPPGYTSYISPITPGIDPLANQGYAGYRPPLPASASGRAVTSLILSIVSWFTCGPLLSIPAMILGKLEMTAIQEGRAPAAGSGYAKAGFWLGLVLTALYFVGGALLAFFGMLGWIIDAARNM